MTDILKKITNEVLLVLELSEILKEKNDAVKDQNYDKASTIRSRELELRKQMLNSTELKDLRKQFNKQ